MSSGKQVTSSCHKFGVNLAGAEFGSNVPGVYNTDYTFPLESEFDYFEGKGLTLIRLPFRWERLQCNLYVPLVVDELARLDAVVGFARSRNMKIILDVHNYARYNNELIGSSCVPFDAFAYFWRNLADHYKNEPTIYAYGIMNEPHDTGGLWPMAAQTAITAIRQVDMVHPIFVSGEGWSSAMNWPSLNDNLKTLTDPANNLVFEAHQYFDADNSGTYSQNYDASGAYSTIGVVRVSKFVNWLRSNDLQGFIGEYGVPDSDIRWLTLLDNTLAYLDAMGVGGTYWAGGPWWGQYPLSVEPQAGQDRPQMSILHKYKGNCDW